MWNLDNSKMLNRAFFAGIISRLSSWIGILRPRSQQSKLPKVYHKIINDDILHKFDEVIIIGDLHGCFDEFMLLLDQIHHRNSDHAPIEQMRILKICAGDLVNKGPKSKEVLDYMMNNADHCISVLGNHEEVVIREYSKYLETGEMLEKNAWMKQLSKAHLNYLTQLPYTISIPQLDIVVVHAGLVPNVAIEEQDLKNMICMRNLSNSADTPGTYQASPSTKQGTAWAQHWLGPPHIFFGHDAVRKLQEYPFATGLDTGAVYGGSLTAKFVKGPRKNEYVVVKALQTWKNPEA